MRYANVYLPPMDLATIRPKNRVEQQQNKTGRGKNWGRKSSLPQTNHLCFCRPI
jgi:hypothetical protein